MRTVGEAALEVLMTADPAKKAAAATDAYAALTTGRLEPGFCPPPDRPARPEKPILLPPNEMPKRRKAGTVANRVALLHAVAHIELNAIDLAFDHALRFGALFPPAFTEDWFRIGAEEAKHYGMLAGRLAELDASYGDLPAHDGLWESAMVTADDPLARLAVVPMVLEARGLDVTPMMIERLNRLGDNASADILKVIYEEERGHVEAGARWFKHWVDGQGLDPVTAWQTAVKRCFRGQLKPPFNDEARAAAGLPQDWYGPLADVDRPTC